MCGKDWRSRRKKKCHHKVKQKQKQNKTTPWYHLYNGTHLHAGSSTQGLEVAETATPA